MIYLLYGAADSAVAKVGIDLDQEVAAHNGGLQLCVALVGGYDCTPPCYLHTQVFRYIYCLKLFQSVLGSVLRCGLEKQIEKCRQECSEVCFQE